jgi:hypothetical protein
VAHAIGLGAVIMTARMHAVGHPAPPGRVNAPLRDDAMPIGWKRLLTSLAALLIGVGLALAWGDRRWQSDTNALRRELSANRQAISPARFTVRELDGLPAPVQRYFLRVLKDGQLMVGTARLTHRGTFNLGQSEPRWSDFTSDQVVTTRRPGFDWDARIVVARGLTVRVHDAYVAGEGRLSAKLMGLVTVADMQGTPAAAQGELMRYLAEAPWYPTALLPSQGPRWQAIDDHSARATLTDGTTTVSLVFGFGADGLIQTIQADARARTVGERIEMTPWRVRLWGYAPRDNALIPLDGEVAWLLPQGPYPYWRGHIESISLEPAR